MSIIPPHIRNKYSGHPQKIRRPVSLKLSEEMIEMLEETAKLHNFRRIQGLIRLYIREGLDRDHAGYTLADDEVFIENLRAKGVSEAIIEEAIIDTHTDCSSKCLLEEQFEEK